MILIATGSPKLQDPNLVYSVLNEIYENISFNETLTIIHGGKLTGTDSFITEWVDERLKPADHVEEKIVTDFNLTDEIKLATIFFQEGDENKEATEIVELLEAKTIAIEKYRSHNFLRGNPNNG